MGVGMGIVQMIPRSQLGPWVSGNTVNPSWKHKRRSRGRETGKMTSDLDMLSVQCYGTSRNAII